MFKRLLHLFRSYMLDDIRTGVLATSIMHREQYVKNLLSESRYQDGRTLTRFGFKVYSQNEEDGIIQEIFARIGPKTRTFIELGVETGLQNNTLNLLLQGWNGLWLECSKPYVDQINLKFRDVIAQKRLQVRQAFIDRDNVNRLIGDSFHGDVDLLSIDIDGNDVHILDCLEVVRPRVIVIEYNGKFPPPMNVAPVYDTSFRWQGSDYNGSSLTAVTNVAERKGYALVACNITGVNAFFVRTELLGDLFCPPYTAERHFEPARYFLAPTFVAGHAADWGPYTSM